MPRREDLGGGALAPCSTVAGLHHRHPDGARSLSVHPGAHADRRGGARWPVRRRLSGCHRVHAATSVVSGRATARSTRRPALPTFRWRPRLPLTTDGRQVQRRLGLRRRARWPSAPLPTPARQWQHAAAGAGRSSSRRRRSCGRGLSPILHDQLQTSVIRGHGRRPGRPAHGDRDRDSPARPVHARMDGDDHGGAA